MPKLYFDGEWKINNYKSMIKDNLKKKRLVYDVWVKSRIKSMMIIDRDENCTRIQTSISYFHKEIKLISLLMGTTK